jgi:hypothetical protein
MKTIIEWKEQWPDDDIVECPCCRIVITLRTTNIKRMKELEIIMTCPRCKRKIGF